MFGSYFGTGFGSFYGSGFSSYGYGLGGFGGGLGIIDGGPSPDVGSDVPDDFGTAFLQEVGSTLRAIFGQGQRSSLNDRNQSGARSQDSGPSVMTALYAIGGVLLLLTGIEIATWK